jgi:CRP-like cAMP-binding protein
MSLAMDRAKKSILLSAIPFFPSMPFQDIEALADLCCEKIINKDQFVFMEGDIPKSLFILKEGRVKIIKESLSGKSVIMRFISPGGVMGEVAIFLNAQYFVSAQALEKSVIYEIPRKALIPFLHEHIGMKDIMIGILVKRLEDCYAVIEGLATKNLEQRLAAVILKMVDNFGHWEGNQVKLTIRLSRQDLAEMTGSTKESVSRLMARLKKTGIVGISRRLIVINDLDHLRAISEGYEK